MKKIRQNNASDEKLVKCSPKNIGMQTFICTAQISQRKRLEKIAKRNEILNYATECLRNGEDLKKVVIKSKIYAEMLKIDTKSITEATIKMLQKKIQNQENEIDDNQER